MVGLKSLVTAIVTGGALFALSGCGGDGSIKEQPAVSTEMPRSEIDFNFDWKFTLSKPEDGQSVTLDDSTWKDIRLPHDWSVALGYSQEETAGATGYVQGGEGWYRKTFKTPQLANGSTAKTQILFDGIYNHSEIWINGYSLGKRPNGYVPILHDLTPHLAKDGSDNVIAVYVDRTRYVDSRWYTGSGIYRNVKLITTGPVHVPIWGTTVTTPEVSSEQAIVVVDIEIANDGDGAQTVTVSTAIQDGAGNRVATQTKDLNLPAGKSQELSLDFVINNPQLWDVSSPNLYHAVTEIRAGETLLDTSRTRFGIRSIRFDANEGFFLNGENMKIKGINLHHEAGLVGTAVPKGVWRRRFETFKEAGVNAIRTAHNPASKEFLDLCDEMGFLVQEEAFDEWDNAKNKRRNFYHRGEVPEIEKGYSFDFPIWAERDLKAMMERDKNHPSIFQWSIGNEIEWSYPKYPMATGYFDKTFKPVAPMHIPPPITPEQSKALFAMIPPVSNELADIAAMLSGWAREVDTTRPLIANMVAPSVSHHSGFADALDIIGYSYRAGLYEYGHTNYPDKMIMGTENFVQQHEWASVVDKPYIAGIFVWTGTDYLGEAERGWPRKGSPAGMLDVAGYKKPSYHMMRSLWDERPNIHMTTQALEKSAYKLDGDVLVEKDPAARKTWLFPRVAEHWNYDAGEMVAVTVYTNQAEVELFQDGTSLGTRRLADNPDRVLKWAVPFAEGTLEARAVGTENTVSTSIQTSTEPTRISLTADKTKVSSGGYDVVHLTAQLVDANGTPIKTSKAEFEFSVGDKLRVLGTDNGSIFNVQPHQTNSLTGHKGRALLIVQSTDAIGSADISVTTEGLAPAKIQLEIVSEE